MSLQLLHPQGLLGVPTHRHILAIVGAAAVVRGDAHTLGEQEVFVTLTSFKAASGAASEARESSTGALAGACADRVVAVGRAPESCGKRGQGGSWLPQDTN